jgi:hypothetical protein
VAQQERKASFDPSRVDTVFHVCDAVMFQNAELLDAAEIGKLWITWERSFRVTALAGPNTYTQAIPKRFKCSPTVNVALLKPYHVRPDRQAPLGPVFDPGQEYAYVIE